MIFVHVTFGHFHDGKWATTDGRLPELFIGGEGLQRGPIPLLGTLLHEAAHGVASTRGVKDTSRQGRYHNTRYRDGHEVAVGRFTVSEPELATQVPGRHVRAAGQCLDVQRLRILAVDPVADTAQPRQVAQPLGRAGTAGHVLIVSWAGS